MEPVEITIPESARFADLKLGRLPGGGVMFDWAPIQLICDASGIDLAVFRDSDEGNVAGLLLEWYAAHLRSGGRRDAVADDLFAEALAEVN